MINEAITVVIATVTTIKVIITVVNATITTVNEAITVVSATIISVKVIVTSKNGAMRSVLERMLAVTGINTIKHFFISHIITKPREGVQKTVSSKNKFKDN